MKQYEKNEPFFISKEAEVEMIDAGYVFEPPLVACIVRLHDVLERMSDAELALLPCEIAD